MEKGGTIWKVRNGFLRHTHLRPWCIWIFLWFPLSQLSGQAIAVSGYVLDSRSNRPIPGVRIQFPGVHESAVSDLTGYFEVRGSCNQDCRLLFEKKGYDQIQVPLNPGQNRIDLGVIILRRAAPVEKMDVLLALSEADLEDEEGISDVVGFLQGSRDIYLNRAAFDFSQVFYRVRGYDSSEGLVLLNGLPMNKLDNGRPQWNNWGGLNDVFRNSSQAYGLGASDEAFGGLLGTMDYILQPSKFRPGARLSTSASNRTYTGRIMATYASGYRDNGFSFAVSASRRWASQGFVEGTLYDAYSLFGALEWDLGRGSGLSACGLFARNRRGRSSPVTEEVYELGGRNYNPNWGWQGKRVRNARERLISEPIILINYLMRTDRIKLRLGTAYQSGTQSQGRLGYYNAPNPDPTYYRYLPSYYLNSEFGNNRENAWNISNAFRGDGQIPWDFLYQANRNNPGGTAAYLTYSQVAKGRTFTAGFTGNIDLGPPWRLDMGLTYRDGKTEYFSRLDDLLGASVHYDLDPFSNTRNNMKGQLEIREGELFGYHYELRLQALDAYAQLQLESKKWEAFSAVGMVSRNYQRTGIFRNARYPDSSFGNGPGNTYDGLSLKGGVGYKPDGRFLLNLLGAVERRPPLSRDVYVNPRENHKQVGYTELPAVASLEMNLLIRLPNLKGRISGYVSNFSNLTETGRFYTDSGLGSDFVTEVLTGIQTRHQGLEFGLEYKPSATVALSLAGNLGAYRYANNPRAALYFHVPAEEQDPIDPSGKVALGEVALEGLHLSRGPQRALSLGISYRDPDFWFISATLNNLSRNFPDVSVLPRTKSFFLDPTTHEAVMEKDNGLIQGLLNQRPLPSVNLLNLVGGKSWLYRGTYIGLFASVNNLLDTVFRTGGFEQSRNGHYEQYVKDKLSSTPSFGPKYWYGYGRTYFVNLSIGF